MSKTFKELEEQEQSVYLASVIHCLINDGKYFEQGCKMINEAKQRGLFDKVKFGAEALQPVQPE